MAQLNSLIVTGKSRFLNEISGVIETASKLGSSTVGGTTTPIYLNAGVPTALGYTIAKSVPSNAVFTDHYAWSDITGKPDSYTPSSHTHPVSQLTWGGGVNLSPTATANGQEWSIDLTPGSYTGTYWHVWSAKLSKTILACYTDDASVQIPNGALTVGGNVTATKFIGDISSGTGLTKSQVTTALGYTPPTSDTNNAVTQTATTTDANYEVLFSATADNTTRTEGARKAATLRFNPSRDALMEGYSTVATGSCSHAEGGVTTANGEFSHAEGYCSYSRGDGAHAEGIETSAYGYAAHAEGSLTTVNGKYSHGEGCKTSVGADSWYSHAEGYGTSTYANSSHTEGYKTVTYDNYAHAEGDRTTANGVSSHSEGSLTCANGSHSHAEGVGTYAHHYAHAEGYYNKAVGNASHAEGGNTTAKGNYSHAGGYLTLAGGNYQTVIGQYNSPNTTDVFQIGWGSAGTRKNIFSVNYNGTAYAAGGFQLPIDPTSTEIANFPNGTMWIQTT